MNRCAVREANWDGQVDNQRNLNQSLLSCPSRNSIRRNVSVSIEQRGLARGTPATVPSIERTLWHALFLTKYLNRKPTTLLTLNPNSPHHRSRWLHNSCHQHHQDSGSRVDKKPLNVPMPARCLTRALTLFLKTRKVPAVVLRIESSSSRRCSGCVGIARAAVPRLRYRSCLANH